MTAPHDGHGSEAARGEDRARRAQARPIAAAVVVGGGIGGMRAALDLADAGLKVFLVEQTPCLGGRVAQLGYMFPQHDRVLCRGTPAHGYGCTRPSISPAYVQHNQHPNIEILMNTRVVDVAGQDGDFTVSLREEPRYVDVGRCVDAGRCAEVCPVERPDDYQQGMTVGCLTCGIGADRREMFFMSGSQAQAFADAAQAVTDRIRLGPNPLKVGASAAGPGLEEEKDDEDEPTFRGRPRSRAPTAAAPRIE